jgi:hypothetical protein
MQLERFLLKPYREIKRLFQTSCNWFVKDYHKIAWESLDAEVCNASGLAVVAYVSVNMCGSGDLLVHFLL